MSLLTSFNQSLKKVYHSFVASNSVIPESEGGNNKSEKQETSAFNGTPNPYQGDLEKLQKNSWSESFKKIYNPQPSVMDEPDLVSKFGDQVYQKTEAFMEKHPQVNKALDEMFWDVEKGQSKSFGEVNLIPPTLAKPLAENILQSALPHLKIANQFYPKTEIQKGTENFVSETLTGLSNTKSLGVAAAMTTPLAPYVALGLAPSGAKASYETGKEAVGDIQAGRVKEATTHGLQSLSNGIMTAAGLKVGVAGVSKNLNAFLKTNPAASTLANSLKVYTEPAPQDILQHEKYKVELRMQMEKPYTKEPELTKAVDKMFRPDESALGNGSSAAAIRNEVLTGNPTKGKWHKQKGKENIIFLQKWMKENPNASPQDISVAKNLILDLQNALGEPLNFNSLDDIKDPQ